jgi:hypothetical protein
MSQYLRRWLCALSGSVRGRISEFRDAHNACGPNKKARQTRRALKVRTATLLRVRKHGHFWRREARILSAQDPMPSILPASVRARSRNGAAGRLKACTHKSRSMSDGWPMSALLPIADIAQHDGNVRFGPQPDSCTAANSITFQSPRLRARAAFGARQCQAPWRP